MSWQETDRPYDLLVRASYKGRAEAIRWLVERGGFDINQPNNWHLEIKGAHQTLNRGDGGTPLHWAIRGGHGYDVIRTMIELGADWSAQNNKGLAPLHIAAGQGKVESVKALLDLGVPIDHLDRDRHIALQHALVSGDHPSQETRLKTLRTLLDAKPSVQALRAATDMGRQAAERARTGQAMHTALVEEELLEALALVMEVLKEYEEGSRADFAPPGA